MLYYEWMNKDKIPKFFSSAGTLFFQAVNSFAFVRYAFYVLGFALINANIFIQHSEGRGIDQERHLSQGVSNFYNMISRPLFVASLAMILMGPLTGKGRLLRAFLGNRGFDPWARISFMTYLIHLLIFGLLYFQTRQANYLDNKQILYKTAACMLLSFLFSIPLSAMLEAPFIQLEKKVFFPQKPRNQEVVEENENLVENYKNESKIHPKLNSTTNGSHTLSFKDSN